MTAPRSSGRNTALRRYPALAWLLGAGVLALLLPSALTVPQSGPPTLAEYAPVPGQGEGQADVAELGQPASGGLGGGGGEGGSQAGGSPASTTVPGGEPAPGRGGGGGVRKPGTKRCVGDPPRQTEDPLSPPCVAFWEGDNGGATAKGVTGDELRVVARFDNVSRDPNDGKVIDCTGPHDPDNDTFQDTLCRTYQKFFDDRYQLYGRRLRLFSAHTGDVNVVEEVDPFAFVDQTAGRSFAEKGILSAGYIPGPRHLYAAHAPRYITLQADREDRMQMAASYVCQKLVGRTARHAGSPVYRGTTRVLGLMHDPGQPYAGEADMLREAVEDRCGHVIEHVHAQGTTGSTAVAQLHAADVTTVIVMSQPLATSSATHQASNLGWFPEWVVPGSPIPRGIDIGFYGRLMNQAQWANAFGLSFDYRRGAIPDQTWFRAYREGCPDCPHPQVGQQGVSNAAFSYETLQMLFYGIQLAGPRLTHENLDKGMHALPAVSSDDPFRPAAYFAPGNYSFFKDAMAIWWDPTGVPPGSTNQGCYRLVADGRRHRAGEWPAGDSDARQAGPCQGETFQ